MPDLSSCFQSLSILASMKWGDLSGIDTCKDQLIIGIRPTLKPMYQRLIDQGKPKKVALIACARKQLITLNAMMKNRTYWIESMA